ncbi:MAG TPA: 4-alpha-glucanotransferase [Acidimicrobiia bacterium]|nr:4-alpha-glucanotransferase [Acidimicrobiia bacterium]
MRFGREGGVLLPVAALPGGVLGDDALKFLDWMADAGQRWWQILPFGPPDEHGSPYAATSAFAGSPTWLARPDARVTSAEIDELVATQGSWAAAWAAYAGPGALADQVRFAREWHRVREHANARGVRILGDMAFAVAAGSADHRATPEIFRPGFVGGVPPDDWSATGQRWGTPVYDWSELRRQGYRWWIERFARTFELVDAVRIDHFRGFVAAWLIPERNRTARAGRWTRGPGRAVFDATRAELGDLALVAENLGLITPAVERLRSELGLPGSVVMQFAFQGDMVNRPPNEPTEHDVVYTGTHDNDTTVGWWRGASEPQRAGVRRALDARGIVEDDPHWMLTRLALASRGAISIVPAQDLLGLGSEARTNTPGRATGNWRWRLPRGALTPALAKRLRAETEASGRLDNG